MKDKIIIKIRGGLGNQLFQYAFAKKIQKKYPQKSIVIDTSYFNKQHIRSLELHKMSISNNIELTNKGKKFFDMIYLIFRLLDRLTKHRMNIKPLYLFGNCYYCCDRMVDYQIRGVKRNIYLAGYFQELDEIKGIKENLMEEIEPHDLSANAKKYLQIIKNVPSIAISIRAGDDYIRFGWPVCSREYYLNTLKSMNTDNVRIIVFADVIDKIKEENWFDGYDVTYIENCNAVEGLYLLSQCKDFIIANSTFSWWGAYLGSAKGKRIVAPETFYPGIKMRDSGLHIPGICYRNNITGELSNSK